MKNSKFYIKDKRSFKEKAISFLESLLFWRGRKKGMVHTMNIKWDHIRAVFFPKDFYEKYKYLGCVPYNKEGEIFKAMEPLVIFMDYKAKPKWCPRWFLRFLHLFGDDNSIVRLRNHTLSKLKRKLTKGYLIWDYKTKWSDYDLRISVSGTDEMHDLCEAIEAYHYDQGRRKDLAEKIKEIDPDTDYSSGYTISMLERELDRLLDREVEKLEKDKK